MALSVRTTSSDIATIAHSRRRNPFRSPHSHSTRLEKLPLLALRRRSTFTSGMKLVSMHMNFRRGVLSLLKYRHCNAVPLFSSWRVGFIGGEKGSTKHV